MSTGRTFPTGVGAPVLLEDLKITGRVRPLHAHPQVQALLALLGQELPDVEVEHDRSDPRPVLHRRGHPLRRHGAGGAPAPTGLRGSDRRAVGAPALAAFNANAAWVQLAITAQAVTRALGVLASTRHAVARGANIRAELVQVAARPARSGRDTITWHLPENWPWQHAWLGVFDATHRAPPAAAA